MMNISNKCFLLLMALLPAAGSGCQSFGSKDSKSQARDRWNDMRGRIKIQLARQHYRAVLFEDAARTAAEAIVLVPQLPEGYVILAQANLELGRVATAEQAVAAARSAGARAPELHYLEGVVREQQGDPEGALTAFTRARQADPRSVDYLVAEAECLVALDRAHDGLALLHEHGGQLDDRATVAALAAQIELLLGQTEAAAHSLRKALKDRADDVQMVEQLGRMLVEGGRCQEALTLLRPVLDSEDEASAKGSLRRAVARCHLGAGDPRRAQAALADYAAAQPDDVHAQLLLAKAAIAASDVLMSLQALDRLERHAPDRPEVWLVRAAVNYKRGRLTAAAADLYDVLQNNPDDVDAHCLLAEILRVQRRTDAARSHFQRARVLDGTCAWASQGLRSLDEEETTPSKPATRLTAAEDGERESPRP